MTRGQNAAAVDFRVKIDTSSATQAQAKYLKVTVSEAAVPPATTPTERPPGHVFVPASSEVFVYDDDGNLTKDGRWNYTWDAENRLATMTTREDLAITAPAPLPIVRLVFRYDAHWRRFDKTVVTKVGTVWQNTRQDRYAYDQWNLIGEWSRTLGQPTGLFQLLRTHNWGPDLSGTQQGAGGVGGLALTRNHRVPNGSGGYGVKSYLPAYLWPAPGF